MQQSEDNECHVLEFVLRCSGLHEIDNYFEQDALKPPSALPGALPPRRVTQMPFYNYPQEQSNINPVRFLYEIPSLQNQVPTLGPHAINNHTFPMMHYNGISFNNSYPHESQFLHPHEPFVIARPVNPPYEMNSGTSFGVSAHLESTPRGAIICVHVPEGIYLFRHSLSQFSNQNNLFHSGTVNAYPTRHLWMEERVQNHTNELPTDGFWEDNELSYLYNNQVNGYPSTNEPNETLNPQARDTFIEEMFRSASFFELERSDEEIVASEDEFDTDTEPDEEVSSNSTIDDIPLEIYMFPGQIFDDVKKCAICLEEFITSEELRILPCRHDFHPWCVNRWLMMKRSCPVCRADF